MSSVMPPTEGRAAPDGAAGIANLAPSDGHAGKHLIVVATSLLLAVISMILICGQQGEAATAGGEVATCGGGSIYLSAKERETFKRHNAIRGRQDLPRFCLHPALQKAARYHSKDMIKRDYFSHDTMGRNEDFSERIEGFGYTSYSTLAENIAYGAGSDGGPRRITRTWMRSDDHRRNILDPRLRQIGIGVVGGNWKGREGTSMYTADFGARRR